MYAPPQWPAAEASSKIEEEIWLLGQPPLHRYLSYVEETLVGSSDTPRSSLVDEWRQANDYYYDLEEIEAGDADQIQVSELPSSLNPAAKKVVEDACYRRAFDTLPTRFAMVELQRLIVSQPHVNLTHAARLKSQLPSEPTLEEVFQFCHPLTRSTPPVDIRRIGDKRYSFTSESSDFRFREAVLLRPDQIIGGEKFGASGVVIGLVVGFSSNFLTAIQSDNRLLLHNGHHRAFALLSHGITHAPCIIQTVTRLDELNLVAGRTVQRSPALYFKGARPPMLKDFLNSKIGKVLLIPRLLQMIDVNFDVQDHEIPG